MLFHKETQKDFLNDIERLTMFSCHVTPDTDMLRCITHQPPDASAFKKPVLRK